MGKVAIGVIHLKPLPGSPQYFSFEEVIESAIRDAEVLYESGMDAAIVENYGDKPFLKEVGKETVASMAVVANEIRKEVGIPLGINVLRNDAIAALSIAKAVKADFIRINQLFFPALTPEGLIEGKAGEILRFKRQIDCKAMIFADISVKHAIHFADVKEYILNAKRSLADALIVTGRTTGMPVDIKELKVVREADMPVLAGSGISPENIHRILRYCDGVIVGTYLKRRGEIDPERVKRIVKAVKNENKG
jgi:hypothetical protein